jgi:hypothetical protein
MARTKRIEKAVPKQAEIISFASLRARREAKLADVFCSVAIIEGDIRVGSLTLCRLKDGTHTIGFIQSGDEEDGWHALCDRIDEVDAVCGRVVSVQLQEAV